MNEMQTPLTQDTTMDPRLDYVYDNHPELQYITVGNERITVGQFFDRYHKSLSYIHRHLENNQLGEKLAPLGLPTANECLRFAEQHDGGYQQYTFSVVQYMERYSAWYGIAHTIITGHAIPPIPELDTCHSN